MTCDFQQCGLYNQQSLSSACAYARSDQSLYRSLAYSMSGEPLTEYHLELLSLKGGCTCSSESTLVKIPHCWKSHVTAQLCFHCYFRGRIFISVLFSTYIVQSLKEPQTIPVSPGTPHLPLMLLLKQSEYQ